ncbi:peptidoglycan-binding protein [Pedobacter sp. MC2016-14]|uniref:peptidoglycan-binding protein n=1 Tax=Pedobacter sp. MC2016-14 TaxID=2897327 RepID=UPI001E60C614|nr:peptidoglycan-binding protein [Pedobacter sp. MC2016-14]MCD0487818.1 peptidoglycan-binding protein [Pedobacter sp. MC2016-14]
MGTVKLLFFVLCLAVAGSRRVPDRNLLISIAQKEVGVRELTGHNDGKRVEEYLRAVALKRGNPWCAAWITWLFKQAGYEAPRTGWSPDLFPAKRCKKEGKPGDVIGIYFSSLGRIAHCGLIEKLHNDWVFSIEGNTNPAGSREGDGVYRRTRHKRGIRKIADWTVDNMIK